MASRNVGRLPGIDSSYQIKLAESGIRTVKDLYAKSRYDLVELLDISFEEASKLFLQVGAAAIPPSTTALQLLCEERRRNGKVIQTMLPPLDSALGGGLPNGAITELVGPAGVGKTQFCLGVSVMACMEYLSDVGRVLYIDTERKFSAERLVEIARSRFPMALEKQAAVAHMLEQVLVKSPKNSAELLFILENLQSSVIDYNIKIIIIDSIAALVRSEFGTQDIADRQKLLGKQASCLKFLAESFRISILVTNQVMSQFDGSRTESLKAALGPLWAHAVNTRLVMSIRRSESNNDEVRTVIIAKSPTSPNICMAYRISEKGLEWLDSLDVFEIEPGSVLDMNIMSKIISFEFI